MNAPGSFHFYGISALHFRISANTFLVMLTFSLPFRHIYMCIDPLNIWHTLGFI